MNLNLIKSLLLIYLFSTTISFLFDIDIAKCNRLEYGLSQEKIFCCSTVGEKCNQVGGKNHHTESSLSSVDVVGEHFNTKKAYSMKIARRNCLICVKSIRGTC